VQKYEAPLKRNVTILLPRREVPKGSAQKGHSNIEIQESKRTEMSHREA
jgi:hypothetical protein